MVSGNRVTRRDVALYSVGVTLHDAWRSLHSEALCNMKLCGVVVRHCCVACSCVMLGGSAQHGFALHRIALHCGWHRIGVVWRC